MTGWVQGTVTELKQWTDRHFSLRVDADVEPFRAGQYNRLRMVVGDEQVARPYSYVNPPDSRPLEFYLVTVPGGPLSNRLAQLRSGDTVELMPRSSGLFTLDRVPDAANLWLLASGTGLGPFLSILATSEPWDRFESIRLVHSVRYAGELAYRERIAELARRAPQRFRYLPIVSRENAPDTLYGRIPAAIGDGCLEAAAAVTIDAVRSQVMICGSPDMVRDTQVVLRTRGLQRLRRGSGGQITVENYW